MKRVNRRVSGESLVAYAVMASGVLMFGAGVYAVATGSRIVQVEAGWTSVIAGSVLIAGGVVTTALGFVTRILLQLRADTRIQRVGVTAEPSPAIATMPAAALEPDVAPKMVSMSGALSEPLSAASSPDEDVPDAERQPHEATDAASAPPDPPPTPPEPVDPPPVKESRNRLRPPPLPRIKQRAGRIAPLAAKPDTPPELPTAPPIAEEMVPLTSPGLVTETVDRNEPARLDEAARPADDYKLEAPSTAEHDLLEREQPEIGAGVDRPAARPLTEPADTDWLDQAFAELDKELPIHVAPRDEPAPSQRVAAETSKTEPSPSPMPVEPEPLHPADDLPPLPSAPAAPPPNTAAVVGRYEADGTAYVMYADGSIEAQSEAGIYRFASMAELKAFIEG